MSIVAIVPVALKVIANATLASAGYGSNNFKSPAYTGVIPNYAILHSWNNSAFLAVLSSIAGVVIDSAAGDPIARLKAIAIANGARWGGQLPQLPLTGAVTANSLYFFEDEVWLVITPFNRTTYPAHPDTYPALIRRVREPGKVSPWVQPIDQFNSYRLINSFTGLPDKCSKDGKPWVTLVDYNVWAPGGAQWAEWIDPNVPIDEWPAWAQRNPDQSYKLYPVNAKVSHNGFHWINTLANNTYEPGVYGWTKV